MRGCRETGELRENPPTSGISCILAGTTPDIPGQPVNRVDFSLVADNWWNTPNCYTAGMNATFVHSHMNHTTTPVEEFWERRVLQITEGINNLGGLQWELVGCLTIGWGLVYLIICRGLHSSGKYTPLILYDCAAQIIWFTALFPYAVLLVLLVRSVTLSGAEQGLLYYITPRWEELLKAEPWIDGASQIFFAYSIGTGALPALGSYNKFHHNCYK
ncbi:hypothetical protein PR048_026944 [Dryococelus australis]|uniref:Uncharacterized protein n=1 Tax=Dryococelus australis TaxID=614101 RepID=A0ABQ9GMS7_9NEOP|nr:hypothetical protein PR048_026944 [Dryococelus australis]